METATEQKSSLWHHSNFLKLWTSDTISQFGTQFSGFAIPFTALLLTKDPLAFGILFACGTLAFPLFALFIGVYVDRHNRKKIMVLSNVGRAAFLGMVPAAAVAGLLVPLGMPLLYVVTFMVGLLTVFFDVSYQAILPSLVDRSQLVEGNSKLEWSRSGSQAVMPGVAGFVVQAVFPPFALAIDASSYMASASVLSRIQREETTNPSNASVLHDLKEGLATVVGDSRLRMIAGSTATSNFFSSALFTVVILYVVLQLNFTAGMYGTIFSVGAIGGLFGAIFLSSRLTRIFGVGPVIVAAMLLGGLGAIPFFVASPTFSSPVFAVLEIPLIGPFRIDPNVLMMMFGSFVTSIAVVLYNINQVSLRQTIVPKRLQGRMNASMRWIVWGTLPAGAFAGGLLGAVLGLKETIGISVIGGILAFLWVFFSPVRTLKKIPEPLE
ncbi:MAG TPA: MFS transporter [Candidatus Bathyarchaeia archaeon]|nr:MFS transporter [Candidatus Bathyarchaeia archaeon]